MNNEIIITTTNTIQNAEIQKYIELISTNVVVGTNIFSDFSASISDIFGGFSETYQNKLQIIYNSAINNLKLKASELGANAIVGLKIDFDEISGKGKSMFMISAIGTAVHISYNSKVDNNIKIQSNKIPNESLEKELTRKNIIEKSKDNKLFTQDEWIYLMNNPISDIAEKILNVYLDEIGRKENFEKTSKMGLLLNYTGKYFKVLEYETATNILYSVITQKPIPILEILKANKLFSAKNVNELFKKEEYNIALECLSINKEYYSIDDLIQMKRLIDLINNLPDKGRIEDIKSLSGSTKQRYICPNGHKNKLDSEFCTTYGCNLNIKGLNPDQLFIIENFKQKTSSLESLLN